MSIVMIQSAECVEQSIGYSPKHGIVSGAIDSMTHSTEHNLSRLIVRQRA
jgi:hypothetical protein